MYRITRTTFRRPQRLSKPRIFFSRDRIAGDTRALPFAFAVGKNACSRFCPSFDNRSPRCARGIRKIPLENSLLVLPDRILDDSKIRIMAIFFFFFFKIRRNLEYFNIYLIRYKYLGIWIKILLISYDFFLSF